MSAFEDVRNEPHVHIRVDTQDYKQELFIPLRLCEEKNMYLYHRELGRMLDKAVSKEMVKIER